MREELGKNVFVHKPGSQERGQGWQNVEDALNSVEELHVTGRSIRDCIMNLIKKYRVKINKEKRETGLVEDELKKLGVLLKLIINISKDNLQKQEAGNEKAMEEEANEQNQAFAIWQIEMGTVSQTKKRSSVDEKAPKQKRSRRSNSQTMEFLIQLDLDKENLAH